MSNAQKEFYLTPEGVTKLKEELEDLTHNQRHKVALRLKEAKEYGDLSENTAWDDAKDQQAFVEGRIAEIENILRHSSLIQPPKVHTAVGLGSTVHLELEDGIQKYTIVGSTEANPDEGRISNDSPIGRALIGKKPGEVVEVAVPSGTMTYKITKVE
jgi:transcription elongation factor GreA